jgi:transposase
MNLDPTVQATRFVGLDLHKDYLVLGAIDAKQKIVMPPRRFALSEFALWQAQHLLATDAIVLEATSNAWTLYDQLVSHVASVTVAHPLLVKLITAARVKTDARDTIKLARLLAGELIPAVWVPPAEVRELRGLVAHRRRLINLRTPARNRLHAVLQRHNIIPSGNGLFALEQRPWWKSLPLPHVEQLRVRQDLAMLDHLEPQVAEVDGELWRLSTTAPWCDQVPFLVQLPGVGALTATVLLAAIGEIQRFPLAKQLVGYSGLGASVHASGQIHRTGRITKQGRREIRAAMVEAAWAAVEHAPFWRQAFERLANRMGRLKASVAIARKLVVVVWHVLTEQQIDRHGDVEQVARKFMNWGTQQRTATRQGLARAAFVRRQLDQLGLGAQLEAFEYGGQKYAIPPSPPGPVEVH